MAEGGAVVEERGRLAVRAIGGCGHVASVGAGDGAEAFVTTVLVKLAL